MAEKSNPEVNLAHEYLIFLLMVSSTRDQAAFFIGELQHGEKYIFNQYLKLSDRLCRKLDKQFLNGSGLEQRAEELVSYINDINRIAKEAAINNKGLAFLTMCENFQAENLAAALQVSE